MTGAFVATKAALKAIEINQTRLHFVGENRAWYYGDSASSATADDENVLQPNTGTGRYLKQLSANLQNALTWQSVSTAGAFTAVANTAYVFDFAAIAADLTVTLPASPALGSTIKFIYGSTTNIQRRLIINPNGSHINGITSNIFAYRQDQIITLEWLGSSMGWVFSSTLDLMPELVGTTQSFSAPASTNLAQDGIINYLGRRNNLSNSYVNPAAGALTNGFFLALFNSHGFNTSTALSVITGRDTSAATALQTWNSLTPAELLVILPMNTSNYNLQYPIILSSIYFQGLNFTSTTISQLVIQGSNSFNEGGSDLWLRPSYINAPPFSTRTDRDLNGISGSAAWETIAIISVASLTAGTGFYGSVANSAFLLSVNSTKAYTAHRILLRHPLTAATVPITEIELYGSVVIPS